MKELAESEILKNIIFITYPRSGINYFAERFEQKTNLYLPRSHFYEKVNKEETFTIVRNPLDTVASLSAMIKKFNDVLSLDEVVDFILEDYYLFYRDIVNKKINQIISYDNFIADPKTVIRNFLDHIRLDYDKIIYKDLLADHDDYVVRSKSLRHYDDIVKIINQRDLLKQEKEYQFSLKRKVFC
jgi:hypothetical protein